MGAGCARALDTVRGREAGWAGMGAYWCWIGLACGAGVYFLPATAAGGNGCPPAIALGKGAWGASVGMAGLGGAVAAAGAAIVAGVGTVGARGWVGGGCSMAPLVVLDVSRWVKTEVGGATGA
mmetsp:Transcript_36168/g.87303  ORF Transcript_36168/g.87303 Transcript_36168/m.87303 type:complete len:123 (+) Transcript_36168:2408-2776(+)